MNDPTITVALIVTLGAIATALITRSTNKAVKSVGDKADIAVTHAKDVAATQKKVASFNEENLRPSNGETLAEIIEGVAGKVTIIKDAQTDTMGALIAHTGNDNRHLPAEKETGNG